MQRSDTGRYCCEVFSEYGSSVITEEAEIALAHGKTTEVVYDPMKSLKQIDHTEGMYGDQVLWGFLHSFQLIVVYLCRVF